VIAIVDYGRGNLGSVEKAFVRLGLPAVVTQDPRVVDDARAVVLPGDGAFHDAMDNLGRLGLLPAVRRALDGTRPFLGICLGYQLLFSTSEEFGEGRGLDLIPGVVRRFPAGRKVPHMGWNTVSHGGRLRLFEGVRENEYFYFVHSYFPVVATATRPARSVGGLTGDARGSGTPDLPAQLDLRGQPDLPGQPDQPGRVDLRAAWCDYGVRFAAAIEFGRIYATQFHPEKSQRWGVRLLENFAAIVKEAA
jgi:imidazole glycerol-phosphate synthase subunit HisH